MEEEEKTTNNVSSSKKCKYFDEVIGHIEDIVLGTEFQSIYLEFLERNWHRIENTEENKFEYIEVFENYTKLIEGFLEAHIKMRMANFDASVFANEIQSNKTFGETECDNEIFELLDSFTNFQAFKELLLDYRRKKEGTLDYLNSGILVTSKLSNENNKVGDN